MQVVRGVADLKSLRSKMRGKYSRVGLVPTMGALHEGHLSLVQRARTIADQVAVSIFVNPAQFGPNEDFHRYPRMLDQDLALLEDKGVDLVFIPDVSEVYPDGYKTFVSVEELSQKLCGMTRPIHFRGVTTIVLKLFNLVQPQFALFGQKDAQQCVIIQRMVQDLCLDVGIVVCPIVREADGLAMSSRNHYLNPAQRKAATVLYQCTEWARQKVAEGEKQTETLLSEIKSKIGKEPLARLDYVAIVDENNLSRVTFLQEKALLAMAAFFGRTRLIDNTFLEPQK